MQLSKILMSETTRPRAFIFDVRGVFGKFKDFCYNLNSKRNWQTRKTPLKYLIILQQAVKIAMWYTHKWENNKENKTYIPGER